MLPEVINYHLINRCNFCCNHCFIGTFDYKPGEYPMLSESQMCELVRQIAMQKNKGKPRKITFTGGEPLLCDWLPNVIAYAKSSDIVTMIVTNGSLLTKKYLDTLVGKLDWLGVTIDSLSHETLRKIGRADRNGQTYIESLKDTLVYAKNLGIKIKINTVITAHNYLENIVDVICELKPARWKILQVIHIREQNDRGWKTSKITKEQFDDFVSRNCYNVSAETTVVVEEDKDIFGSYAMIDPQGRFFDNATGTYTYSHPILDVGCQKAFQEITFSHEKFHKRGGNYNF